MFRKIFEAIQFIVKLFIEQSSAQTKVQQPQPPNINIYITNNQGEKPKT